MADVLVVGAGVIGAACAYYATLAGCQVTVVDRGQPGAGTTSRGEGNILVSDKSPGPELDLALLSQGLWRHLGEQLGAPRMELEAKGGLVVGADDLSWAGLQRFAGAQTGHGVQAVEVAADDVTQFEPHLARDLAGAVHYPQDLQVQPVLATALLLQAARAAGAKVVHGTKVVDLLRYRDGAVAGVQTDAGRMLAGQVVNATGTWAGEVSERFGCPVPVLPRRGFVLVTEPLPRIVRHKVYSADYVANVAAGSAALETSAVVEGTPGGTVLIGASRERVGFDGALSPSVVRRLAQQAVRLFPMLADVQLLRAYHGFRPYCPDHLPVIGPDPRIPGVVHAAGHEGAGIGLAPATGLLVSQILTGRTTTMDIRPFDPGRFLRAQAKERV